MLGAKWMVPVHRTTVAIGNNRHPLYGQDHFPMLVPSLPFGVNAFLCPSASLLYLFHHRIFCHLAPV